MPAPTSKKPQHLPPSRLKKKPTVKEYEPYKQYLKGGNSKLKQELPCPIMDKGTLVGYEWKFFNIIEIIKRIPIYNPFRNCEGYYFDLDEMNQFITFVISECIYPEGKHTGKSFIPELWQWAVYLNIFCWKRIDNNNRRYKEVFIYVPRKNGKTVGFGSIPTLYMFFVDKENRSQNFACAADIEQASLNFFHTAYMIEQNVNLISRLRNKKVFRSTRSFEHAKDGSMFKVLSSIAETKHGLSPNFAYVDEIHAHKSSELIDVMVTGTAAREQSLSIYTTTADYDRESICNDMYFRAKSIAKGESDDSSFLPVIYEAEVEDDFKSIIVWKKANPNFGVSIYPAYFERQIKVCLDNPTLLNRFLRLHLNIRTKVETVWIPSWIWNKGKGSADELLTVSEIKDKLFEFKHWHNYANSNDWWHSPQTDLYLEDFRHYYTWYFKQLEELKDEECYGGYDNTSVNDIAAFTLYFPKRMVSLAWFWVPAESIYRRSTEENIPYNRWYKSGLINNIPMACISEKDVTETLLGSNGILKYFENCRLVCVDAWGSNFLFEACFQAAIPTKKYPQSYAGMNGPCQKLEADISNIQHFHGNNPIQTWMIQNVTITMNNNNQKRTSKEKSSDKIDGIASLLMSIGGYMYNDSQVISEIVGLRDDI